MNGDYEGLEADSVAHNTGVLEFGSGACNEARDRSAIQACNRRYFTAKPIFPLDKAVSDDDDEDDSEDYDYEDNDEDDDEDDNENDNSNAECDFSVYLEQYLKKNKGAWNNHRPDVNNWPRIRYTGNSKKKWPQKMAIEAAFRYFNATNASHMVELLDDTINAIKDHYISQKGKKTSQKGKKNSQKEKKDSRSYENESSLIRTTKSACEKAWQVWVGIKEHKQTWDNLIPPHAQILACQFVAKNGQINSSIATYLTAMSKAHLQQVSTISTGDREKDREACNLALSAINTAANALKAAEANEEKFEERLKKPLQALTVLRDEVIAIDAKVHVLEEKLDKQEDKLNKEPAIEAKVNALEEKLDKQPATLKKELKAELNGVFKTEQAHLKKQLIKELREELQGKLDKDLAEFKKTQLGKGQVTGSGSTPPAPTSTPSKRGSTSSESGLPKKSRLESSLFDFTKK
ncbi:unnamed protein product [Fusarium equiseti]|uniref:Uncharacterized protein n=1 Tax=Fusarium equiseti TaxID=61235 RepID=A0A8J2NFR9_FUSEQ|nr:unnamed protein product [Fusarium equiseti]